MAEENAFARILNRMSAADAGITEKTASAPSTPEPDASARMLSTVRAVTNTVKTAAVTTPKASLEKMAAEAQQAEEAQLIKQAQFMGAALADGFMERFAQYDVALGNVKVAGEGDAGGGEAPRGSANLGHYILGAPITGAIEAGEGNRMRGFGTGYLNALKEGLIGAGAGGLGGAAIGGLAGHFGGAGAGRGAAMGGAGGAYLGGLAGNLHSVGTTYDEVKDPSFKGGSAHSDLEKVAQAAYAQAVKDMEKKAAAEFESGYNDQLKQVHKLAADIHFVGQQTASALVQQARTGK